MRVVTLEEHFTLRSLSAQVSPDAIVAKGWFSADNPFGPAAPGEKFDAVGEGRIAALGSSVPISTASLGLPTCPGRSRMHARTNLNAASKSLAS